MIILDTNIVSEAGHLSANPNLAAWFRKQDLLELYLCGPVVMEQAYGADKFLLKTGSDKYVLVLNDLIHNQFNSRIIEFDGAAPRLAGKLRAKRGSLGRPISTPDSMIAAICLAHGAALATRNVRDFDGLDLKLINPFEAGA